MHAALSPLAPVSQPAADAAPLAQLLPTLARLRAAHRAQPFPALEQRLQWLLGVEQGLRQNSEQLIQAISADFGHRSPHDTRLGDLWLALSQLRYLRSQLPHWIQPQAVNPLWVLRPGRARIFYQPLGVVGIIAPWNYPIQLSVSPLAGALAAGNRVLLKLSEHTPRTSECLAQVLERAVPADVLSVVLGDSSYGKAVASLQLDHLLFTGGHSIGKQVALAAAQNMVPVTLELGGKSPAILHSSYPVKPFAERVMFGKCFSVGQSCVAPDYALVPRALLPAVRQACAEAVAQLFPTLLNNPDYTALASAARKQRVQDLIADAVQRGAQVQELNPAAESLQTSRKLAPTLLWDVPADSAVLHEEIFGPVLPLIPYDDLQQALHYVAERPRPLALYYFDNDSERIAHVLKYSSSGGVTINDTLLHFLCDELPREPVGASGYGSYSGRSSFETFSHAKSVFQQAALSLTPSLAPPYGRWVDWVLRSVLRV